VKEERNILHTIRRKAGYTGHAWRTNCYFKHVIEGKIEGRSEDEEDDLSSYWINLRNREDTGS
jgi:hypothetical protein